MKKSELWDTSADKGKFRRFFGIVLLKIPYSIVEISPFYLWGREPPLSILNSYPTPTPFQKLCIRPCDTPETYIIRLLIRYSILTNDGRQDDNALLMLKVGYHTESRCQYQPAGFSSAFNRLEPGWGNQHGLYTGAVL